MYILYVILTIATYHHAINDTLGFAVTTWTTEDVHSTLENEKIAKIHDYIADVKRDVYELKGLVMSNSEKVNQMVLKLEKLSTDMYVEIDGLKEKYELHQLKLNVSEEEFHNYSQVVDIVEKKICKFFSLSYPLVPFPPNSIL